MTQHDDTSLRARMHTVNETVGFNGELLLHCHGFKAFTPQFIRSIELQLPNEARYAERLVSTLEKQGVYDSTHGSPLEWQYKALREGADRADKLLRSEFKKMSRAEQKAHLRNYPKFQSVLDADPLLARVGQHARHIAEDIGQKIAYTTAGALQDPMIHYLIERELMTGLRELEKEQPKSGADWRNQVRRDIMAMKGNPR
ncbi:MAG: hypothetical protein ACOYNL_03040 [Rickettsiales bacterium]